MRPVIDLECDLPADEEGNSRGVDGLAMTRPIQEAPGRLPPREGYGFENYSRIFTTKAQEKGASSSGESLSSFVHRMTSAGVETGLVRAQSNDVTCSIVQAHPEKFIGMAYLDPRDGMPAVRELERLVRDEGLGAFGVSSLNNNIAASDARYYPLYAKCVELDIPVRIYSAMNYANDRPYDVGHPKHIDQVAIDFPELRLVAGLGGWPWVSDMVGLLRRHPNLFCDTSAHRPKYFAQQGSGWEQFTHFGNTLNQDKIMIGLSSTLIGADFGELIAEYETLPLKESVKDKWFYGNARRFFGLD